MYRLYRPMRRTDCEKHRHQSGQLPKNIIISSLKKEKKGKIHYLNPLNPLRANEQNQDSSLQSVPGNFCLLLSEEQFNLQDFLGWRNTAVPVRSFLSRHSVRVFRKSRPEPNSLSQNMSSEHLNCTEKSQIGFIFALGFCT